MPRKPSATKGFPCSPEDCYVNRHLEPNVFKMYDTMMAFAAAGQKSRGNAKLVFTAAIRPTLCNAYNCAESTATDMVERLCALGWIIKHEGGRDQRTGKKLANTYEMLEHDEFVNRHPHSCPHYLFAPDGATAEAYGVHRRGERLGQDYLPRNFWKPDTPFSVMDPASDMGTPSSVAFGAAIAEWWASLSEEQRAVWNDGMNKAREALTVSAFPETDHLRIPGEGTVPANADSPSPHSREDRPRIPGVTVPANAESILYKAVLETPSHKPHLTAGGVVVPEEDTAMDATERTAARERVMEVFIKSENRIPKTNANQDAAIEQLIVKHRECAVAAAMKVYLEESPFKTIKGEETRYPLSNFIRNFDRLLAVANARPKPITANQIEATKALARQRWEEEHHMKVGEAIQDSEPGPEALFKD